MTSLFIGGVLEQPCVANNINPLLSDRRDPPPLCSAGPRINLRLIGRMTGAGSSGKRYWPEGDRRDFAREIIGWRCGDHWPHQSGDGSYSNAPPSRSEGFYSDTSALLGDRGRIGRTGRNLRETQPGNQNKSPDKRGGDRYDSLLQEESVLQIKKRAGINPISSRLH
ncbi:hypothetical protein QQF64_029520 [Cirrhinus molitorella]|uniref:Uncharacterized protein n=1 Tax=Cirrhinus molitorella TaxID=172907 RepID=A0ABR3N0T4_9TELE